MHNWPRRGSNTVIKLNTVDASSCCFRTTVYNGVREGALERSDITHIEGIIVGIGDQAGWGTNGLDRLEQYP